jgi:hypothetical protein
VVRSSRHLLHPVKGLVELSVLGAVDHLGVGAVEEGVLDIQLVHMLAHGDGQS